MFTMSEIIEFAIRIEENGEKVYRDASEKAEWALRPFRENHFAARDEISQKRYEE